MTVLGLELFLNSVRTIITENGGIVFLKFLLSPFQVSLPYKVRSLRKRVHFNLVMLFFQDKSYFRSPESQRTLSSLVLTYHNLQKTSLQIKDVMSNIESHGYHDIRGHLFDFFFSTVLNHSAVCNCRGISAVKI